MLIIGSIRGCVGDSLLIVCVNPVATLHLLLIKPHSKFGLSHFDFEDKELIRPKIIVIHLVNIAAGFIRETPLLLVDEPTASLDAHNRGVVMDMIEEKLATGTAVLGIFHDETVRERVADRIVDVTRFAAKAAA